MPDYTMTIALRPIVLPVIVPKAMDVSITSGSKPNNPAEVLPSLTGHIYILLGQKSESGINERTFGFYPKEDGTGHIKGPGALRSEARCKPDEECGDPHFAMSLRNKAADASKISNDVGVTFSERITITKAQYDAILNKAAEWSSKGYNLIDSNCIAFVADAVRAAGYDPPSNTAQLPTFYIGELTKAIRQQDEVRALAEQTRVAQQQAKDAQDGQKSAENAAAAARAEANRERGKAAQAKADLDLAQDKVDQLEAEKLASQKALQVKQENDRMIADAIHAGWIRCTCPQSHSNLGKVINGQRWHPDYGNNCPK